MEEKNKKKKSSIGIRSGWDQGGSGRHRIIGDVLSSWLPMNERSSDRAIKLAKLGAKASTADHADEQRNKLENRTYLAVGLIARLARFLRYSRSACALVCAPMRSLTWLIINHINSVLESTFYVIMIRSIFLPNLALSKVWSKVLSKVMSRKFHASSFMAYPTNAHSNMPYPMGGQIFKVIFCNSDCWFRFLEKIYQRKVPSVLQFL